MVRAFGKMWFILMAGAAALLITSIFFACHIPGEGGGSGPVEESFDPADEPQFMEFTEGVRTYYVNKPWNYEKSYNRSRRYPLVIFLHGTTSSPTKGNVPGHLGNGSGQAALHFKKSYPSFVYVPLCPSTRGWHTDRAAIIDDIERLKRECRIDPDRIYLMGYSKGASETVNFGRAYNRGTRAFAAIVRLSGMTGIRLEEDLKQALPLTSIWFNSGNNDLGGSQTAAAGGFALFKQYYDQAKLRTSYTKVGTIPCRTEALFIEGGREVKYSLYGDSANPAGHGTIYSAPFNNPELMPWLFRQRLDY